MWSDGFNCAPPFLAAMGFHDEALAQIEGYRQRLWNPDKKLLAHIWDDQKKQLRDGNFWGGGNGWAAAGLARVWRSLPKERRVDRQRVADFARGLVDGCLAHQRPDGLFHNVVDQPATFVETNLAQMLAFAIYEGVAAGWLPASYRAHADAMRVAARLSGCRRLCSGRMRRTQLRPSRPLYRGPGLLHHDGGRRQPMRSRWHLQTIVPMLLASGVLPAQQPANAALHLEVQEKNGTRIIDSATAMGPSQTDLEPRSTFIASIGRAIASFSADPANSRAAGPEHARVPALSA